MIDRQSDFFKLSKEIAVDFLQSTVIIDDSTLPRYPSSEDRTLVLPMSGRRPPLQSEGQMVQTESPSSQQSVKDTDTEIDQSSNPYFDARAVISAFAKKRIVCSVINPQEAERDSLPELIRSLADCADILVIDWSLHNDEGEMAMEILASILGQDGIRGFGRLRLLAIYTGNPAIAMIGTTIKEHLDSKLPSPVEEGPDEFTLSYGATRVVILAKPERAMIPQNYHNRIVEFDNLAEFLTDEFTQMTAGLVSNVVVSAFSSVRKNTYRVLSQFCNDLDSPYLSHRFMLPEPHDAENHISALVAAELQALLEETKIGRNAGIDAIRAWFDAKGFQGFMLDFASSQHHTFSRDDVLVVLEGGLSKLNGLSSKNRDRLNEEVHKKQITKHFSSEIEAEAALDERFATISLMRSYYDETVPTLTLGTIVKNVIGEESSYYVCVQPRCDCVRLSSERSFPFLPLTIDRSWFDTVFLDNGHYVRLRVMRKPHQIKLIRFMPRSSDNGVIVARREDGQLYFEDVEQQRYQWISELRGDHGLRLSSEFASTIGRIGLDESEWLRRWATKR